MTLLEKIKGRDPVDEKKFTWLGSIGGWQYGQLRDREYAVSLSPLSDESVELKPGEILVRRNRDVALEDGARWPVTKLHLGIAVERGYFEKHRRTTSRNAPSEPRRWNILDAYRRTSSDPRRFTLRQARNADLGAMKAALEVDEPAPWVELAAHGLTDTAPGAIVRYLGRRGITLELGRGHVIARSAKPINIADRELMETAESLIVGELGGPVPLCSLCDEPAVGIAIPRAPVCEAHAQ